MTKQNKIENLPTNQIVVKFEMLSPMLEAVFIEIQNLSKKKQNDPLNKLKVKMVNKILDEFKEILADEPTIQFLDLLDDQTLPSNSDCVLILAQYRSALSQFKSKFYYKSLYSSKKIWHTKEDPQNI
ncbi:MAG: hypothetical protein KAJ19_25135 [Gammaproteobacteria bacterium]|nr:hypothetical protein [Gammaproteobacteria bacterium]